MSQLKVNSIIPVAGVPTGGGGGIVQIVNSTTETQASTTSTSYTDTGLSVSITPTSSSSKVLILVSQAYRLRNTSGSSTGADIRLVRGSTEIVKGPENYGIWFASSGSSVDYFQRINYHYLDSPATTSATTYKTTFAVYTSASEMNVQPYATNSSGTGYITAMEVSG